MSSGKSKHLKDLSANSTLPLLAQTVSRVVPFPTFKPTFNDGSDYKVLRENSNNVNNFYSKFFNKKFTNIKSIAA